MAQFGKLTKSAGNCAQYSIKSYAKIFKNVTNEVQRQERLKSHLTKVYGRYNTHLYLDRNRYVVKDKSSYEQSCEALRDIRTNIKENMYFLKKSNEEKKKCFETIENIQKQCSGFKRRNNIVAQTKYDPEKPTLWMKVKDMYAPTNYFIYPQKLYEL